MNRGYIKLWRKLEDSQHFSMGLKYIGMFDYLLIKANWRTGWFLGVEIKPGSMGTSISSLADEVNEHRHTVRNMLKNLEKYRMISVKNIANRWTHISICNWDTYQQESDEDNQTKVKPKSNRLPTDCQPTATIKEVKNLKELKNKPYMETAERLAFIIVDLTSTMIKSDAVIEKWANDIRLSVEQDGMTIDRINLALNHLAIYGTETYCPVVRSGAALREKMVKIEDAIKRKKGKDNDRANGNGLSSNITAGANESTDWDKVQEAANLRTVQQSIPR